MQDFPPTENLCHFCQKPRFETKVQKTLFQIRDADDAVRARLADIRKDFAGIDLHDCPADTKKPDDSKKG